MYRYAQTRWKEKATHHCSPFLGFSGCWGNAGVITTLCFVLGLAVSSSHFLFLLSHSCCMKIAIQYCLNYKTIYMQWQPFTWLQGLTARTLLHNCNNTMFFLMNYYIFFPFSSEVFTLLLRFITNIEVYLRCNWALQPWSIHQCNQ